MAEDVNNIGGVDISAIKVASIALHEMFLSLVEAGFTQHQALVFLVEMTRPRTN